jgi:predicted transcriptional regulator
MTNNRKIKRRKEIRKIHKLGFRATDELKAKIQEYADLYGVSMSKIIELSLDDFFRKNKTDLG